MSLIAQFCQLIILSATVHCGSYFENVHVPKFSMGGEDREKFLLHSQEQAIANVMAARATKIEKHMSKIQRDRMQNCTQASNDFLSYAACFKTVWKKGKLMKRRRVKVVKGRRRQKKSMDYPEGLEVAKMQMDTILAIQQQQQQQELYKQMFIHNVPQQTSLSGPSPIATVSDWLTNFFHALKEPKVIIDDGTSFIRPAKSSTKPKKKSHFGKNILEGTLVGKMIKDMFGTINGLTDFVDSCSTMKCQKNFEMKTIIRKYIEQSDFDSSLQRDQLPEWHSEFIHDAQHMFMEMANNSETVDYANEFILSPRLLPLSPQEPGQRFLSPDILTFNENDTEALGNVPQMLNSLGSRDKESLLKFILEMSGAEEYAKQMFGGMDELLNKKHEPIDDETSKLDLNQIYGESANIYENIFGELYSMITDGQVQQMTKDGYAFLKPDQLEVIYGKNSTVNASFNIALYNTLSDEEKDTALLEYFANISESADSHKRNKRLIVSPIVLNPVILLPSVLNPVILSPFVLSPIILSPSVLGPIILSPLVLSPLILSPGVLNPLILSPTVFTPCILSPGVLGPVILSPDVGGPLIICPQVLGPTILSPLVLGGLYLSPLVLGVTLVSPLLLFPIILSPLVFNPFILAPFALTPVILSPLVFSVGILDPNVLSPFILSPFFFSPLFLCPGILSPLIKSPTFASPFFRSSRVFSPELLSPNLDSPKHYYTSFASPSILSRRRKRNSKKYQRYNPKKRFLSITMPFDDEFFYV